MKKIDKIYDRYYDGRKKKYIALVRCGKLNGTWNIIQLFFNTEQEVNNVQVGDLVRE